MRGDKVEINSGPHRGKQGIVKRVIRRQAAVIVEGLNMATRFDVATEAAPGRMYEQEKPLHYSQVQLVDPSTGLKTKVHRRVMEDGEKVRVSSSSGTVIPKPDILKERAVKRAMNAKTDTPPDAALSVT